MLLPPSLILCIGDICENFITLGDKLNVTSLLARLNGQRDQPATRQIHVAPSTSVQVSVYMFVIIMVCVAVILIM